MNPRILLAIPCYNCENQIGRVLDKTANMVVDPIEKIIVIDNCSADNTLQVVLNAPSSEKVEIYQNEQNRGLGGTFKFVTHYANKYNYDYIIFLHGDDQADPADISSMLQILGENSNLDAILGARFMPSSKLRGYSKSREIANRVLNLFFTIITRRRVFELGSGLNLYRVSALVDQGYQSWPDHIAFDIFLLMSFLKLNVIFHPISWSESDQRSTTSNISVTLKIFTSLFRWHFRNFFQTKNFPPTEARRIR